jgi:hypothetical protein
MIPISVMLALTHRLDTDDQTRMPLTGDSLVWVVPPWRRPDLAEGPCAGCGYQMRVFRPLASCPMCGDPAWHPAPAEVGPS